MKYYIGFVDEAASLVRSNVECVHRGSALPEDVTKYWWSTIEKLDNTEWGLYIVEAEIPTSSLTQEEIDGLKTEQWMIDNGWK